jgi:hypothetical protein
MRSRGGPGAPARSGRARQSRRRDRVYLRQPAASDGVPVFPTSEAAEKYIKARASGDQRGEQAALAGAWTERDGSMVYIGAIGPGWVRVYPQIGNVAPHSGYTPRECIEYR